MFLQANFAPEPYTYGTYDPNPYATAGVGATFWIFFILMMVVTLVPMALVFKKAGQGWWKAFVPLYNSIVLIEMVKRPIWWFVLLFIPFVNLVIVIILMNDLSKAFGHGMGFTLGLIFFSFIFLLILAFDSSKYVYAEGAQVKVTPPTGDVTPQSPQTAQPTQSAQPVN